MRLPARPSGSAPGGQQSQIVCQPLGSHLAEREADPLHAVAVDQHDTRCVIEVVELGRDLPALAISVDPANDTPQSARAFLSEQRMTGRLRFVLGSRPELRRVWDGYGIQPQLDDLDHTARIVLVDGDGVQRVGYPLGEVTPERLAHDLRLLAAGR